MALIKCNECGKQVSSKAEACPACGNPLHSRRDVVGGRQVRTVEKTAKKYKAQYVLFKIMNVIGVLWIAILFLGDFKPAFYGMVALIIFCSIAFFGAIITKIQIWWHHG